MARRRRRQIVVRFREDRAGYEVDYRDVRGKRHRPLFETEEAANEHVGKLAEELRSGLRDVDDPDLTLAVYVTRWLARAETEREIEPKTLGSYRYLLTTHIVPTLGPYRLRDLRPKHVRNLLGTMRAAQHGKGDKARGYAKNTIRLVKAALSSVLTDAIEDEYISTNPAYNTGRKKKRGLKITQIELIAKIRPLDHDELTALLRATATDPLNALWALMAKAGLRPGEAAATRVDDADLRRLTLTVERSATDGGGVEPIKSTKTARARSVDLSRDLAAILRRHITRLRANALKAGTGEPSYLFPTGTGRLLNRYGIRDAFKRARKQAGIGHRRPYDLRHTYASLLLDRNAPLPYVADQLGHANPATTLRYYAHCMPKQRQRWVDLLDETRSAFVEPQHGTSDETGIAAELANA